MGRGFAAVLSIWDYFNKVEVRWISDESSKD